MLHAGDVTPNKDVIAMWVNDHREEELVILYIKSFYIHQLTVQIKCVNIMFINVNICSLLFFGNNVSVLVFVVNLNLLYINKCFYLL